ncbi:MAG: hypothetical protein A2X36_11885 [Elusimicrobia bacterium GWA2_69_24]|nr:MAG: hypothetical protein A2X36_11885 [Elusimicrobia bacterium GWA2_69_24]
METPLLELADRVVEWIGRKAPGLEAEAYLLRSRDRGIDLKDGVADTIQESSEGGMGLRLFDGKRMAFSFCGGLEPEMIGDLFARAASQLPHLPADPDRALPVAAAGAVPAPEGEALPATLHDPWIFSRPIQEFIPELREMEARAKRADPRIAKVLQVGYGENASEVAISSTRGIRACERGTSCSGGLYAMASAGDDVQVGSASRFARFRKDLDLGRVADEAVFRTVSLLGARKLPSRRRAVLFDPWLAGEIVDLVASPMSAEMVQRGKSLLKGRVGERIASPAVTFVDDPWLPGGVSSARFDDEGVPTQRKTMIDQGVLCDYFYDTYTARKDGRSSNGCAGRAGFRGLPAATPSNFFMRPGKMTREELIADTKDGILVLELMGMHMTDPISGEVSVGISGVAITDGEITHGIRGAMLSCGLLDLLNSIDGVADDLTFYGSLAAPTFRASDLTVA